MNQKEKITNLWEKILQGDLEALREFYALLYPDLYKYALKITDQIDLAEDAVQDVFVDLWNYKLQLNNIQSPKFYLIRSVKNQCLKLLKKQKRFSDLSQIANYDIPIFPEELQLIDQNIQTKKIIQKAINQLSPRQREVIFLKFYNNLDYEELAEVLDINYQSVVNHIHKAMQKLRDLDVLKYFKY